MQMTSAPDLTAGTICGSTSFRLDCVLMQTTSGFVASTFSKSVGAIRKACMPVRE